MATEPIVNFLKSKTFELGNFLEPFSNSYSKIKTSPVRFKTLKEFKGTTQIGLSLVNSTYVSLSKSAGTSRKRTKLNECNAKQWKEIS